MSEPSIDSANLPEIGSLWLECDNRFTREVEVIPGYDSVYQRIRIKNSKTGRITWASLHRFDGRSGGYSRIVDSMGNHLKNPWPKPIEEH